MKKNKNILNLLKNYNFYFFILLLCIIVISFFSVKFDILSDDGHYMEMLKNYKSVSKFINFTYYNINGRIIANLIMYFFIKYKLLIIWKIISILSFLSISYNISKLFLKKPKLNNVNLILTLMMCCSYRVLSSSMFWFTGAIFYLWPVAILTYLLRLLSDDFFTKNRTKFSKKYVINVILGILLMFWSEQVSLVLIGFYACKFFYQTIIKKEKINLFDLISIIIWIISFLFMFLAPSQKIRMNVDLGYDALNGGIFYMISNGISWMYRTIFLEQRILIIIIGIVTILYGGNKKTKKLLSIFKILLSISCFALIFEGASISEYIDIKNFFYSFNLINRSNLFSFDIIPYIYWTIYFGIIIIINLYNQKNPFMYLLIILASLLTLIILWFSPTMYVSGNRTCILFCIGIITLVYKIVKDNKITPYIESLGIINILLFILQISQKYIIFY